MIEQSFKVLPYICHEKQNKKPQCKGDMVFSKELKAPSYRCKLGSRTFTPVINDIEVSLSSLFSHAIKTKERHRCHRR